MNTASNVITWIASYPKSGNTWVRFLLLNLLYGPQSTTTDLDVLIPDIHKCTGNLSIPAHARPLVKTHFLPSTLGPFMDRTAGIIYVVRNPIDTMLSNMNYAFVKHGITNDPEIREDLKPQYIDQFIQYCGEPWWIQRGMGTWTENVRCWLANDKSQPTLVLRYEDLRSEPARELGRIANFLDINPAPAEIEAAVADSSFERMRQIEERELTENIPGFFLSENSAESLAKGNRFMHRGQVGFGNAELTESQRARFMDQFGPTMEQLGYHP